MLTWSSSPRPLLVHWTHSGIEAIVADAATYLELWELAT